MADSMDGDRPHKAAGNEGSYLKKAENPFRARVMREHQQSLTREWRDSSSEMRSRASDYSRGQNKRDTEHGSNISFSSHRVSEPIGQSNGDFPSKVCMEPLSEIEKSGLLDHEMQVSTSDGPVNKDETCLRTSDADTSPEELFWYYKDPHDEIQGPFPGRDLVGWFEEGYFGTHLQVRLANAPLHSSFTSLGNVMPRLQSKEFVPLGSCSSKENDVNTLNGKNICEAEISRQGPINVSKSEEAEHISLESVKTSPTATLLSSSSPKGKLESIIPDSCDTTVYMNNFLNQRLTIEREKPLLGNAECQGGNPQTPSVIRRAGVSGVKVPHTKVLQPETEVCQTLEGTKHIDLMSLLPKSASSTASSAHTGLIQHFASQAMSGIQQERLLKHDPDPQCLPHLSTYFYEYQAKASIPPVKSLSSKIAQGVQSLPLPQNNRRLSQLQLQYPFTSSAQQSALDKILLLKKNQKKEQELLVRELQQQLHSEISSQKQEQQLILQQHMQLVSKISSILSSRKAFQQPSGDPQDSASGESILGNHLVPKSCISHQTCSVAQNSVSQECISGNHPPMQQMHVSLQAGESYDIKKSPARDLPHADITDVKVIKSEPSPLWFPHQIFGQHLQATGSTDLPPVENASDTGVQNTAGEAIEILETSIVCEMHDPQRKIEESRSIGSPDIGNAEAVSFSETIMSDRGHNPLPIVVDGVCNSSFVSVITDEDKMVDYEIGSCDNHLDTCSHEEREPNPVDKTKLLSGTGDESEVALSKATIPDIDLSATSKSSYVDIAGPFGKNYRREDFHDQETEDIIICPENQFLDGVKDKSEQPQFPSGVQHESSPRTSKWQKPSRNKNKAPRVAATDGGDSEARDFREWCESELMRLTGSRDTSLLEFCLKQPISEAEVLLKENLHSVDPDHEFVDKLLSYKELLSLELIEQALETRT